MKTLSTKDIRNLLYYDDYEEDETRFPCYQASIDKENRVVNFLIDEELKYTLPLPANKTLSVRELSFLLKMFKNDKLEKMVDLL